MHLEPGVDGPHFKATYWRNMEIKALYGQGYSVSQIAKKMRLNEKTASAICCVLGLRRKR